MAKKKKEVGTLSVEAVAIQQCPAQPWKNGRGMTRELARSQDDPFSWRLSSARIEQAGPFSEFLNYERVICIVAGGAVTLSHSNGKEKKVEPLNPYRFSGDLKTEAIPTMDVIDLNLFLLRGAAKGSMFPFVLSLGEEYQLPLSASEHFVFCAEGIITVTERHNGIQKQLKPQEFARITRTGNKEYPNLKVVSLAPLSKAIWIPIHLL